eukprot:974348-Alexandrium_andersonii.AAC.1
MYVLRRCARHHPAPRDPESGWPRAASKLETRAAAPRPSAPRKAGNWFCNQSMLEIYPAGPANVCAPPGRPAPPGSPGPGKWMAPRRVETRNVRCCPPVFRAPPGREWALQPVGA